MQSLITALRGGAQTQSPPPTALPPGITLFGNSANSTPGAATQTTPTTASATTFPGFGSYGQNNLLDPSATTATTATTAALRGSDPFAPGRALNQQYGAAFQSETGSALPDMGPYTGAFGRRYAQELSTPQGRKGLATDMGRAQSEESRGGIYQQGDLTPIISKVNMGNPAVRKWWESNYDSIFGNGNSYFIPDTSEVSFIPQDDAMSVFQKPGELRSAMDDRLRNANRYLNNTDPGWGSQMMRDAVMLQPENDIRNLLTVKSGAFSNWGPNDPRSALRAASNELASFDVGRGSLNDEQGSAISRALEFQDYYNNMKTSVTGLETQIGQLQNQLANLAPDPANMQTYEQTKSALEGQIASLQGTLDFRRNALTNSERDYNERMAVINGINPEGLSSAEIIRALRGG